jgi:hypothetical protein
MAELLWRFLRRKALILKNWLRVMAKARTEQQRRKIRTGDG